MRALGLSDKQARILLELVEAEPFSLHKSFDLAIIKIQLELIRPRSFPWDVFEE